MKKHCIILLTCLILFDLCALRGSAPGLAQTVMNQAAQDKVFMAQALELARLAAQSGNGPFGALLVKDGRVVARAENTTISDKVISHHAELNLMNQAFHDLGVKSLEGYTLYASAEPCPMCSGAILLSKVSTVVYGAPQEYLHTLVRGYRAIGITDMKSLFRLQKVTVRGPVLREQAEKILTDYLEAEKHKGTKH